MSFQFFFRKKLTCGGGKSGQPQNDDDKLHDCFLFVNLKCVFVYFNQIKMVDLIYKKEINSSVTII